METKKLSNTVKDWLSRVERIPARLDALEAERKAYEIAIESAEDTFNTLACHPLAPEIMRLRYIVRMPVWKIANTVSYSERRVYSIIEESIDELEITLEGTLTSGGTLSNSRGTTYSENAGGTTGGDES